MKKRYIIGLIIFLLLGACAVYALGNEEGQRAQLTGDTSGCTAAWGSDCNEQGWQERLFRQNKEHINQYAHEAEEDFRRHDNMGVQILTQSRHQLECEDRLYQQGELELLGGSGVCES